MTYRIKIIIEWAGANVLAGKIVDGADPISHLKDGGEVN